MRSARTARASAPRAADHAQDVVERVAVAVEVEHRRQAAARRAPPLTAAQQAQELNGPVNKAIIDTAKFLKEQGKVPAAGSDYSQYVTDRFVK